MGEQTEMDGWTDGWMSKQKERKRWMDEWTDDWARSQTQRDRKTKEMQYIFLLFQLSRNIIFHILNNYTFVFAMATPCTCCEVAESCCNRRWKWQKSASIATGSGK